MIAVYGYKSTKPEMVITFPPPTPLTFMERLKLVAYRALSVGLIGLLGVAASTVAPLPTIYFVASFIIVMVYGKAFGR